METKGWKSFWTALWVSLLVLLPLVAGTAVLAQQQAAGRVRASEQQSGVPVRMPREEHHLTLLACVAGEEPAFVLLYLNAGQNCIHLLAVPGQLAVPFSDGEASLADCYAAAGPARCLQGLGAVFDLPEDAHYLAASPETLDALCAGYGSWRVGFSGALSPAELARFEQSGVGDWDAASAHAFLRELDAALAPETAAAARAAVWDAFFRQNLDLLPAALPETLRSESGALLTDLTAPDLLTLEDTLEFLANGGAAVESAVLPGRYDRRSGFYLPDEGADEAVQAFFNVSERAAASGAQSASSSAPYPSTSVPGGQEAESSM